LLDNTTAMGAHLLSNLAEEKQVQAVIADCLSRGVIIGATNRSIPGLNNTLCLSPALIATADDIDHITNTIGAALDKVFGTK